MTGRRLSTGRRRKAPGKTWSATSSIGWFDASGAQIARTPDVETMPSGAVMAKVYYRVNGRDKKPTFRGDDLRGQVAGFQALLAAAYHGDWLADDRGRPMPPRPLPTASHRNGPSATQGADEPAPPAAIPASRVSPYRSGSDVAAAAEPATLPATGSADDCSDVAGLVRWYTRQMKTSTKRRGGTKRSPNTLGQYNTHLGFLLEHAVHQAGDPRLDRLGVKPGTPMSVRNVQDGINERDLILLLELRASTNRRTRAANERAMTA